MPTLFPHQRAAVTWLGCRPRHGLFDDQGLGKTAAAIVAAKGKGRLLVVAPTVVAHNWQREIATWAPERRVQVITSGNTGLDPNADAVVVTHGLLLNARVHAALTSRLWGATVLDEAHLMRGARSAKRAQRFYGLRTVTKKGKVESGVGIVARSESCWLLTGSPMPNNPSELWTMLAGLQPDRLLDGKTRMSYLQFRDRFCELAPAMHGDGWRVVGTKNLTELRQRLRGFAMRRMKEQVLDLPPLRYGEVEVTADSLPQELRALEKKYRGMPPEDVLAAVQQDAAFSTWRRICGTVKALPAADLLASDLNSGMQKVVVVHHHREVGAILRDELHAYGVVEINGSTTAARRQENVDRFQTDPRVRVAVVQINAGGVGITLTAASDLVFVEQSFTPGDNAQVRDRIYRIGQTRRVLVRSLSLAGSIDELLTTILANKTKMVNEVLR